MDLKIKIIDGYVVEIPRYATHHAAGLDLFLPEFTNEFLTELRLQNPSINKSLISDSNLIVDPQSIVKIPLGISVKIPNNYYLEAKDKSGLSMKGLKKLAQLIDADYPGMLYASFINVINSPITLSSRMKIIQLVANKFVRCTINSRKSKGLIKRVGGFGSTGD